MLFSAALAGEEGRGQREGKEASRRGRGKKGEAKGKGRTNGQGGMLGEDKRGDTNRQASGIGERGYLL